MTPKNYKFDEFTLDVLKRQLERDGVVVPLKPKAFDLLHALVAQSGKLLSKDDLLESVWDGQIVEESNLTVNMSAIRKALGERASEPRFIATVSGQGYRFVGDVRESGISAPPVNGFEQEAGLKIDGDDMKSLPAGASTPVRSEKSFGERHYLSLIVAVTVVFFGIAAVLWLRAPEKRTVTPRPIAMKRLTELGNVTNAALSPDGKLFAYALQEKDGRRSLWLGHVDGGSESINLLPPLDVTIHGITFGPGGGSLFYVLTSAEYDGGALFKVPVFGGVPEKIRETVGSYITLSPDGKKFAFVLNNTAAGTSSLISIDMARLTETEIASRSIGLSFTSTSVAWSPDGRLLAVSATTDERTPTTEILAVSIEDLSVTSITSLGWNNIRALAWTHDGTGLYAVAGEQEARFDSQIWHISIPTGEATRVVSDLNVYGSTLGLSPSGNEMLTLQSQHYSNIWVSPDDNVGAARQITFELLGKRSGWDTLEWTVDGRIAYTAFSNAGETVWVMDADGKNQRPLIPEGRTTSHHSFSSDGTRLVFDSNRSGELEVWTSKGDGTAMQQLTMGGNNSQPHVAPSGRSIVYRSVRDGQGYLRMLQTGSGESTSFGDQPARWPRFSPDGNFVACVYGTGKNTRLAILRSNDAAPVKFFDYPISANFNNGIRWTPDGKALTYRDWNNGIWRQNIDLEDPSRIEGLPEEKLYSYGWSSDGKQFAFTRGTEIRDAVLITGLQ